LRCKSGGKSSFQWEVQNFLTLEIFVNGRRNIVLVQQLTTREMEREWVVPVSGAVAGLLEACLCQPLDVVKTRLQQDRRTQYPSMSNCFRQVYRQEGWKTLYKGLTPFSAHLICKYALRFGTYGALENRLGSPFLAGLAAGAVEAVTVVTPCEVVKTRLQQVGSRFRGPIDCLRQTVRTEGIVNGLLRGCWPTIIRQSSNQATNFWAADLINRHLWKKRDRKHMLPVWQTAITGLVAGSVGPILNQPFDVVKSRLMQTNSPYSGTWHALRSISKQEGCLALYRGFLPRITRVATGQMIAWTTVLRLQALLS
jgi:solute carrier family 25 (mitochondrial citrate transporter), member 1